MKPVTKKLFVISLGGSLIYPKEIDTNFLLGFKHAILTGVKSGYRFIIICGGGKLARNFNSALEQATKPKKEQLDWLGINSTWLNAKLIQLMFGKFAHPEISQNPEHKINFKQPILVGGGWKPGRSSDGAMVKYAEVYKAKNIINLSNIDFVCDKDPRLFSDAKTLTNISWNELLKITGTKWSPGANLPFDPTASKLAKKNKMTLIVANGRNYKNLTNIFDNKDFQGTVVN